MLPAWVERWPIPTLFPVGDVNAYYLPGRTPTIVDPGPKTPAAIAALDRFLDGRRVRRVVVTHHHVDHAGLAATLQRDHGAELACHASDGAVLAEWSERSADRQQDYEEGLRRAGVPEVHRETMRYGGQKYEALSETVKPDVRLEEGDDLELGDQPFHVLHAPGHTSGSILVRHRDRGSTFSGDTLLARITPNAVSVRRSERDALPTYLKTLRRLEREPLGLVLPGHGRTFDDAADVVSRGLRHAKARQARLLRIVATFPGTAFQLTERLFLRLPEHQLFLAVSETLGHLEDLERQGFLEKTIVDGVDRYAVRHARHL